MFKSNLLKGEKGFTLVEMVIVIIIIGILASIVLVGLGSFRARGRDARRIADLRQTQNALELYYTANQAYAPVSGSDTWASLTTALTGGGIGITTISNDPLPANTYQYGVSADRQNYVLMATLEDGNNPSLRDDTDGTFYGINCADPNYCVQF